MYFLSVQILQKKIEINPKPTNLNDYQFQERIENSGFLFKAIKKNTNKKFLIHFFDKSNGSWGNCVKTIYMNGLSKIYWPLFLLLILYIIKFFVKVYGQIFFKKF